MIYPIKVDEHVDERLKEFHAKLSDDQKVVHIQATEKYLFILTEKKGQKSSLDTKNLLLEEFRQKAKLK